MDVIEAEQLVPLGLIDMDRMLMPAYKNTVTGDVGMLEDLSKRPGALWQATWIAGEPWFLRMPDGKAQFVRPEEDS